MMPSINKQDYLKHLFVLQQKHTEPVPMGELATAVGVAPASATGMVKSLVDKGLVDYEPYYGVSLTANGEKLALDVIRRHRLIEVFLVETLGLDWAEVHEEAEALEHAISDKLLQRIDDYLDNPTADPHGDPIPPANGKLQRTKRQTLAEAEIAQPLRIARVVDQDAEFLNYIDRIGLRPGTKLSIEAHDTQAALLTLKISDNRIITLSETAAKKLLIDAA